MGRHLPQSINGYDKRDYRGSQLTMDFRQLRYFTTLFEEGSITKAARRLGVVQPALSMQIKKLEDEFQTQLFERTSRGVDPTPIGIAFYHKAITILNEAREASIFLRDSGGKVIGDLTIGVMPSLAASALSSVVAEFSQNYPHVKLRLLEAYSDSLTERLLKGSLDFAFINDEQGHAELGYTKLYEDHLVLIRRHDPNRHETVFPASQLGSLKLVLPSVRQGMRRAMDALLMTTPFVIEPQIEIDSLNAVLELISETDYASIFPSLAVKRAVLAGRIQASRIVEPVFCHNVVVAYSQSHQPSLAGRTFIELLKAKTFTMLDEFAGLQGN